MNAAELGRSMFFRRCRCTLDCAPGTDILAWETDPGIRDFWTAEAAYVLGLLKGDAA